MHIFTSFKKGCGKDIYIDNGFIFFVLDGMYRGIQSELVT
jgi:hypothetical protein